MQHCTNAGLQCIEHVARNWLRVRPQRLGKPDGDARWHKPGIGGKTDFLLDAAESRVEQTKRDRKIAALESHNMFRPQYSEPRKKSPSR
jgi:hypothetical protein